MSPPPRDHVELGDASVGPARAAPEEGDGRFVTEDVVYRASDPSALGLISQVPGQEEEEEPYSDEEDFELEDGHLRVCWLSGEEEVEDAADLRVMDRALMHGDIVARAADPLGQTGHVVGVHLTVDLEAADQRRVSGVPSHYLRHLRLFRPGMYVVHGTWLGRIQEVVDSVFVQFDDGSVCKVVNATPELLIFKDEKQNLFVDEDQSPFYPGQSVRATSSFVFRHSKWVQGSWKNKWEGVVVQVEAGEVDVDWIAACKFGDDSGAPPPATSDPKDLRLFSYFAYTCWQLGDRALLHNGLALADLQALTREGGALPEELPQPAGGRGRGEGDGAPGGDPAAPEKPEPTPAEAAAPADAAPATAPEDSAIAHGRGGARRAEADRPSSSTNTGPHGRRRRSGAGRTPAVSTKKKEDRKAWSIPEVVQVVQTRTLVDVQWQDGSVTKKLEARTLFPLVHFGDHDLWPEMYVEEVGDGEDEEADLLDGRIDPPAPRRSGLVRSMDAAGRTATITWLKHGADGLLESPSEDSVTEQVSVYELREHADYNYRLGDVVLRLSNDDPPDGSNSEGPPVPESVPEDALSWVGEITGLENGSLRILWADGQASCVSPQKVFVVSREEDEVDSQGEEEDISEGSGWETASDEEAEGGAEMDEVAAQWQAQEAMAAEVALLQGSQLPEFVSSAQLAAALERAHAALSSSAPGSRVGGSAQEDTSQALVSAPVGQLSGASAGMSGGSAARTSETQVKANLQLLANVQKSWNAPDGLGSVLNSLLSSGAGAPAAAAAGTAAATQSPAAEEPSDSAPNGPAEDGLPEEFLRYGEAEGPATDHYYGTFTDKPLNMKQWQKRVLTEIKNLSTNLPATIWVRAYTERMGLFRAAILGAKGTPYHDNLFFFDIYLPPDYPNVPPDVHYHSSGRRINPNLYENGKVCLSLLNTWNGDEDEMWSPSSTLLQVLVSIQGLVLVPKPFYNEAGYEKHVGTPEGEKHAALYNENTFLLSCRSMMDAIRRPPDHFQPLVVEHFRRVRTSLLAKVDEYLEGRAVGHAHTAASATQDPAGAAPADGGSSGSGSGSGTDSGGGGGAAELDEFDMPSSDGFRLLLAKLKPRLATAFEAL
eukprot:jgi/Tetstr1/429048/TSEL_019013.t1